MNDVRQTLVWDIPTRVFHWMFAAGFFVAAYFAFATDDDSRLFSYHAIAGLTIALMIIMRIVWGFVGTRYARFSSFVFGPRDVIDYLIGVVRGSHIVHVGHNPGGAWAAFVMFALVLGLAVTGLLMGRGNDEAEELHELCAYAMCAVVALHIGGVILHTVRRRENIIASMVHGRKQVDSGVGIASSRPIVALIFIALSGAWVYGLLKNYDAVSQSIQVPIVGYSVVIGESEGEHGEHESEDHDDD